MHAGSIRQGADEMLAYKPTRHVSFEGKRYRVNYAFDVILRIFELATDDRLTEIEKIELQAEMLIGRNRLSIQQKQRIIEYIFRGLVDERQGPDKERLLDFKQDAKYIYASFWQAYGIDLVEQQGKLSWQKFMALFEGLPADTKIMEVISIRARPVPRATKYNQDEIRNLLKLKKAYRLKVSDKDKADTFQAGVDRFVSKLLG